MTHRRESAGLRAYVATSRSMIRVVMLVIVLFGLILIFNEILEQTVLCDAGVCNKLHWSPMGWGLALIVFGCLALQRGDVSVSLKEFGDFGDRVASWRRLFGRRAYDKTAAPIAAEVAGELAAPDPAGDVDTEKDERVDRPKFAPTKVEAH